MVRFNSLLAWIILLHVIVVTATAIVLSLMLYWFMNTATRDLHNQAMRKQAEQIVRYVRPRPEGGWTLALPEGLKDLYSEAYGRYFYAVLDDRGNVLFSSRANHSAIFQLDKKTPAPEFRDERTENKLIDGVSLPETVAGQTLWFQVAEDLAHRDVIIDDIVADFFQRVGWVTLPVLFILLAIDIVIFRRAMAPLFRASEQARQITPEQIDVRLPIVSIPKEILPLVTAVNAALDRLEMGYRRQREFTADAAHELRTPLTILRTRIETLPDRKTVEALRGDIERMSRVVSQLLESAELDTFVADPNELVDLQEVCADVAEQIAPLALMEGKSIMITGAQSSILIKGSARMINRAVRNLVENAIYHTPVNTSVEIEIGIDGTINVLDRGRGIRPSERAFIFQRFWRGEHRQTTGAGLGLSIVKRIVDAHGGTIAVKDRDGGGAQFTLAFALAGHDSHVMPA